jgi:hypothetical protein
MQEEFNMRNIYTLVIFSLCACNLATGQDSLFLSKSGAVFNSSAVSDIDSIVFHNSPGKTFKGSFNVYEINNIQIPFELKEFRNLSFSNGDLLINGNTKLGEFDISGIYFMTFKDISTGISPSARQKPGTINVFPNPVNNELQISYQIAEPNVLQIEIIDLQGKIWHQQTATGQPGFNKATVSVMQLPAGMYICRLQNGSMTEVFKFLKK